MEFWHNTTFFWHVVGINTNKHNGRNHEGEQTLIIDHDPPKVNIYLGEMKPKITFWR